MKTIYTVTGTGELLEVYEDKLAITPKGIIGLVSKGLKGTKTIPFYAITALQFKKAGFTKGYLQFTIPGGIESKKGVFAATTDENTFMFGGGLFSSDQQNELVLEIKNYIEKRIQELHKHHETVPAANLSDELQKLAKLKEQGILSEEEFQSAKMKLIG